MREGQQRFKQCKGCSKMLPISFKDEYCPQCEESQLFDDVREFIRQYDVNEYQVAEHFGIPQQKVKGWIREGRIEYKEKSDKKSISTLRCSRCGGPVNFGSLCSRCLKLLNNEKYEYIGGNTEKDKMFFLDQDNK